MTLKAQKPDIKADVTDFIKGAQAEKSVRQEVSSGKKDKTFLLRLPHSLWKDAKLRAGKDEQTLHDFIVQAVKDKITA
ncbi:MAG: hypothetical protein K4571_19945 [Deltaproteobacteria bacterium]